MTADLPIQSIAAIATLVAALIAAAMSFVSLTLNKEQKTSEFRQTWIDALREDLAVFFACARAFARVSEERHKLGDEYAEKSLFKIDEKRVSDIRYQISEVYSRIKLRLNPNEIEHEELLRLMQRSIDEQNKVLANRSDSSEVIQAIEVAIKYARPLIKAEWNRVKAGELPFRIARNWVAPFIFLLSISAIAFVWNGTFTC
jgi:hypothetical protein